MAPQLRPNLRPSEAQNRDDDQPAGDNASGNVNSELFLEPMMGTPLAIYIEKDVQDRDNLADLVTKHGGTISPGYSGVPYVLVDPYKESGQSLFRQYAGKKGKIVLDARWVHECIRLGELQTFHTNWAGCKVIGTELTQPQPQQNGTATTSSAPSTPSRGRGGGRRGRPPRPRPQATQPLPPPPPAEPPTHAQNGAQNGISPIGPPPPILTHMPFTYHLPYNPQQPRPMLHPSISAPHPNWHPPGTLPPHPGQVQMGQPQQLPQILPRPPTSYDRPEDWNDFANHGMVPDGQGGPPGYYDNRFREWGGAPPPFQQYHPFPPPQPPSSSHYMPLPSPNLEPPPMAEESEVSQPDGEKRGRKRMRAQATPAPPASTLVLNRRHPPARSPTPPTRVIKSTYGGNLFTSDDIVYLKRYIDYCQEQGLVLSLREICERVAIKAPHHTFYSWRRYCNKHQIRLGGYAMDVEGRPPSPAPGPGEEHDIEEESTIREPGPNTVAAAQRLLEEGGIRDKSPTPPRALYRSTTGKGVAFTDEDVAFLVKLLAYRKSQGRLDMVSFWKDVATKAPHHSRASWMKYYRRHKHELNHVDGDDPLPTPPSKKMRYGKNDDVLLAKYFVSRPEGTSDKVFQDFARIHSHHPWKGWQEHHRIHKAKLDHLILRLANGESIDEDETADE